MTVVLLALICIGVVWVSPVVLSWFLPDPPWRRSKAEMDIDWERAVRQAKRKATE